MCKMADKHIATRITSFVITAVYKHWLHKHSVMLWFLVIPNVFPMEHELRQWRITFRYWARISVLAPTEGVLFLCF